jgi:hypothetical protein
MAGGKSKALAIPVPGPGRKSLYRPEYAEQARKLCLLGYTDEELAKFFNVATSTFYKWQHDHPAFSEAIIAGKDVADAEVADSLYKRATGEYIQLEKLVKVKGEDGKETYEAVRYKSFLPGDPQAAFRWLLNRRRLNWADKSEMVHSGTIEHVSKEQRDAAAQAFQRTAAEEAGETLQ